MSETTMTTRCRSTLAAACLFGAVPLACAGDAVLSAADMPARLAAGADDGWFAGTGGAAAAVGAPAAEVFAGYLGRVGAVGYGALVRTRGDAGAADLFDDGEPHGAGLSAGLNWKSLYARYDMSFARDAFGIAGARGTGYMDVGARHPIGRSTFLNLHAGDGRVAGAGNMLWDWKDLRAGFSRKLEDGWTMVMNVRRVYANNLQADRRAMAPRTAGPNPALMRGQRSLVVTFRRGF